MGVRDFYAHALRMIKASQLAERRHMISILTAVPESSAIVSIISQVGFPIAMCIALFWYIKTENAANREKIDKLSEAFNGNTLVMTKLLERMDKDAR